jgi:hypothetical protein
MSLPYSQSARGHWGSVRGVSPCRSGATERLSTTAPGDFGSVVGAPPPTAPLTASWLCWCAHTPCLPGCQSTDYASLSLHLFPKSAYGGPAEAEKARSLHRSAFPPEPCHRSLLPTTLHIPRPHLTQHTQAAHHTCIQATSWTRGRMGPEQGPKFYFCAEEGGAKPCGWGSIKKGASLHLHSTSGMMAGSTSGRGNHDSGTKDGLDRNTVYQLHHTSGSIMVKPTTWSHLCTNLV